MLIIISCHKYNPDTVDPPDPPKQKDTLQVVWYSYVRDNSDTVSRFCLKPVFFNNFVITSSFNIPGPEKEQFHCFNKKTGEREWIWQDYFDRGFGSRINFRDHIRYIDPSGSFLLAEAYSFYNIDLNTGKTINSLNFYPYIDALQGGTLDVTYYKDGFLASYGFNDIPNTDSSILYQIDKNNMDIREILKIKNSGEYYPFIQNTYLHVRPNNDTFLIGSFGWLKIKHSEEKYDLFCYNLTKKEFVWKKDSFSKQLNNNLYLQDGKLYCVAYNDFYSIEIETGDIIWKGGPSFTDEGFFLDPLTIAEGKIFAKTTLGHMFCVDQNTGSVIWSNKKHEESGAASLGQNSKIEYYKGKIYFSDNTMRILDASNGSLLHKYNSPKSVPQYPENYIEGITIDPESELMYFTDGYHLICAKIPK